MEQIGSVGYSLGIDTRGFTKAKQEVVGGFKQIDNAALGVKTSLHAIGVAVSAVLVSQQIVHYANEWDNLQNRLKIVTKSTQDLASATAEVFAIANRARADVGGVAELYATLNRFASDLVDNQHDLARITETVSIAMSTGGGTAHAQAGALRQLAQALGSGVLRGDEFNSVMEQAPDLQIAIAKHLGVTTGQLRSLAENGKLTASTLVDAFLAYESVMKDRIATATETFSQSMTIANNNMVEYIGNSELVQSTLRAFADSVVYLSANMEHLERIIYGAALGFGTYSLAVKVLPAILGAYATATATATTVTGGLTVALRALIAATPVGLLLTIGTALGMWALGLGETKEEAKLTKLEIDKLINSYRELTEEERKSAVGDLLQSRIKATSDLIELTKERAKIEKQIADIDANIESQRGELGSASLIRGMENYKQGLLANVAETDKAIKEINQLLNSLSTNAAAAFDSMIPREGEFTNLSGEVTAETQKIIDKLKERTLQLQLDREAYEDHQLAQLITAEMSAVERDALQKQIDLYKLAREERAKLDEQKKKEKEEEQKKAQLGEEAQSIFQEVETPAQKAQRELGEKLTVLQWYYSEEKRLLDQSLAEKELSEADYQARLQALQEKSLAAEEQLRSNHDLEQQASMARLAETANWLGQEFGNAYAQYANGSMSAKEATKALGRSIMQQVVTSLAQMALANAFATTQAAATGAAITASMAPAAATASVATMGGAAAAGSTALMAAMPAMISAIMGSGRLYGGNTQSGRMYPINEDGRSEILQEGGKQYLLSSGKGRVISNRDMPQVGGGSNVMVNITTPPNTQSSYEEIERDNMRIINVVVRNVMEYGDIHRAMTTTSTAQGRVL